MGQIDINGAHCFDDAEAKMEKLSNTSEIDREIALASARMSDKAIREIIFRTRNHEASGTNSAENLARLAETELCVIENVAFSRRLEMPTDGHDFSDAELEKVAANTNWRNQPVASIARDLLSTRKELAALQEATRWIPVGERLPEDEKFVLLIHDANGLSPRVGYRVGDSWHDPLFTWREMNIPTHWMPLPVPPKGGE